MPEPFASPQATPNAQSSLTSWLSYLEQLHPSEIDLGLERIGLVGQRLNLKLVEAQGSANSSSVKNTSAKDSTSLKSQAKILSIAGTNGKGSTLAFLQSLALAHKLRVGSYTSPHFLRFNERIQINGQPVSDAQLIQAFRSIQNARLQAPAISLSYFEFATLAAFICFEQASLDLILLEVGLGGRLDAVNLVDADVSVLVTVAQDHADYLGTDLEQIGLEKAGIFRPQQPVVLGSADLPASVTKQAQLLNCAVFQLGTDFQADGQPWLQLPALKLPPSNAATAVQAFTILAEKFALVPELNWPQISSALAATCLTGRMQQLDNWLLDVAHNPAAADYLAQNLANSKVAAQQRLGVLGMLADKDITNSLQPLIAHFDAWVVLSLPNPRAMPATELSQILENLGARVVFSAQEPAQNTAALNFAQQQNYQQLVGLGSFVTVAEILAFKNSTG